MKWKILESPQFAEQFAWVHKQIKRADEFIEGAKWILERDALRGVTVSDNPPVYALGLNEQAGREKLSLYYTIAFQK